MTLPFLFAKFTSAIMETIKFYIERRLNYDHIINLINYFRSSIYDFVRRSTNLIRSTNCNRYYCMHREVNQEARRQIATKEEES
jgi:predicted DNA-binding protein YlxM (UPF0122 family)